MFASRRGEFFGVTPVRVGPPPTVGPRASVRFTAPARLRPTLELISQPSRGGRPSPGAIPPRFVPPSFIPSPGRGGGRPSLIPIIPGLPSPPVIPPSPPVKPPIPPTLFPPSPPITPPTRPPIFPPSPPITPPTRPPIFPPSPPVRPPISPPFLPPRPPTRPPVVPITDFVGERRRDKRRREDLFGAAFNPSFTALGLQIVGTPRKVKGFTGFGPGGGIEIRAILPERIRPRFTI